MFNEQYRAKRIADGREQAEADRAYRQLLDNQDAGRMVSVY